MPLTKAMQESIEMIKNDLPMAQMMTAVEKIKHFHPKLSGLGVQDMLFEVFDDWSQIKVIRLYNEYRTINPDDYFMEGG